MTSSAPLIRAVGGSGTLVHMFTRTVGTTFVRPEPTVRHGRIVPPARSATIRDLWIDPDVNPGAARMLGAAQESQRRMETQRAAAAQAEVVRRRDFARAERRLREAQYFLPPMSEETLRRAHDLLYGGVRALPRDKNGDAVVPPGAEFDFPAYEEVEPLILSGPPWHGGRGQPLYRDSTSVRVPPLPQRNPLAIDVWRDLQTRITLAEHEDDIYAALRKLWYFFAPAGDPNNIDPEWRRGGAVIVEPRRRFATSAVKMGDIPMVVFETFFPSSSDAAAVVSTPHNLSKTFSNRSVNGEGMMQWCNTHRMAPDDAMRARPAREDRYITETVLILDPHRAAAARRNGSRAGVRSGPRAGANVCRARAWMKYFAYNVIVQYAASSRPTRVLPFYHWGRGVLLAYAPRNILYYVWKYSAKRANKPGKNRRVELVVPSGK